MKISYYPETDSLYIELSERPSVDSQEIAPGVVLDFDEQGNLVGLDIDRASILLQLDEVQISGLPAKRLLFAK